LVDSIGRALSRHVSPDAYLSAVGFCLPLHIEEILTALRSAAPPLPLACRVGVELSIGTVGFALFGLLGFI
jgi:hypothetical protein